MTLLHTEFTVNSYDQWKEIFDDDPAGREAGGVRAYRIGREVANPDHVTLDLEFEQPDAAEAFLERLRPVWASAADRGVIHDARGVVFDTQDEVRL